MSATPTTVSGHFMLEPSSVNNAALDNGTTGTISATTTGTVANTTAAVNELLLVGVAISSGTVQVTGITDTRLLTWHKLAATTGAAVRAEIWWAWEPTNQSHTMTVTLSASGTAVLVAGSFSGVQSGSASMPFDPTALTAFFQTSTAATTTGNIANPADMLIGFCASLSNPSFTAGAGYTSVATAASGATVSGGMEYQTLTPTAASTGGGQTFNYTLGSSHANVMIGVALMSSGNNVQVISATAAQEFILKNVFTNGKLAVCKWDGVTPEYVTTTTMPLTNMTLQVTATTFNVVLINVGAASPIEVGYDGIRSV